MVLWFVEYEGAFVPVLGCPGPVGDDVTTLKATLEDLLERLEVAPADLAVMFFRQSGALRFRLVGVPEAVQRAIAKLRDHRVVGHHMVVR